MSNPTKAHPPCLAANPRRAGRAEPSRNCRIMRAAFGSVLALMLTPAPAQIERFEGAWNVVLTCPPHAAADDDARGYTHRFPAQVSNGEFRGTFGSEGEVGYKFLHGRIAADGAAVLRLDGIVNDPRHAIRNATRGKPYTYRVAAKFEESSGTGQRQSGRVCTFAFSR